MFPLFLVMTVINKVERSAKPLYILFNVPVYSSVESTDLLLRPFNHRFEKLITKSVVGFMSIHIKPTHVYILV